MPRGWAGGVGQRPEVWQPRPRAGEDDVVRVYTRLQRTTYERLVEAHELYGHSLSYVITLCVEYGQTRALEALGADAREALEDDTPEDDADGGPV